MKQALESAKKRYEYYDQLYKNTYHMKRYESLTVYLKLLLRQEEYACIAQLLDSFYERFIEPIFSTAAASFSDVEELAAYLNTVYHYVNVYLSVGQGFPQVNITDQMMYDLVLSCKNPYSRIWKIVKQHRTSDLNKHDQRLAEYELKHTVFKDTDNIVKKIEQAKRQAELKRSISADSSSVLTYHLPMLHVTDIDIQKEQLLIEFFLSYSIDLTSDENLMSCLLQPEKHLEYKMYVVGRDSETGGTALLSCRSFSADQLWEVYEEGDLGDIYDVLLAPVEAFMHNKTTIIVGMEPITSQIPFQCCIDADDNYLNEKYQFIYVETGRDVKPEKKITRLSDAVVIGGPQYHIKTFAEKGEQYLQNLYFSEREAKIIAKLLKAKHCLIGREARKAALVKYHPAILHIASHAGVAERDSDNEFVHYELVSAYIALAGYNDYQKNGVTDKRYGNGILTGFELSMIDMTTTDLVMLATCKSGLPTGENLESGQGLRWAVKLAGAGASITSLWTVSDQAAAFFSITFYSRLKVHGIISKAMREAQTIMRKITKQEILMDPLYKRLELECYLEQYRDNERPFDDPNDWGFFMYQMN